MKQETRDFKLLLEYNAHMNLLMLNVLKDQEILYDDCVRLLSHIINAQTVWLMRLKNESTSGNIVWEIHDLDKLEENIRLDGQNWDHYLETTGHDLEKQVSYTNTKGERFQNSIADILTHVINHGTHHRGQISLMLRQKGIAPPATDYIMYRRQNL